MKRLPVFLAICLIPFLTQAQSDSGFGIKGGLNYNTNGDYFESIGAVAEDPDGNVGYHLGVFYRFGKRIYVRPELVFTRTKSGYSSGDFKMSKLDGPLLVGFKIIGPLHFFLGPSFQYILDTEFDGISIDDIENDFTFGLHIGAGVNLGKLGLDIRYERGFSSNEASFINDNLVTVGESRIDTRPSQLIVSLSVKL